MSQMVRAAEGAVGLTEQDCEAEHRRLHRLSGENSIGPEVGTAKALGAQGGRGAGLRVSRQRRAFQANRACRRDRTGCCESEDQEDGALAESSRGQRSPTLLLGNTTPLRVLGRGHEPGQQYVGGGR